MYPVGPYATPVPSFPRPVPVPVSSPGDGPLFFIGVNCEWMPYIAGALLQLLLQSTWNTSDTDRIIKVQGQVFDLISRFNCATAPTLADLQGLQGSGCEEDCMCCLRVENGILQQLVCGVWTDVPGQPPGGFFPEPQPGAGSPQPPPGGGCQLYHATLPGASRWIAPTVVSSGDTIEILNAQGATNDTTDPTWYCPDGERFFGGFCIGITDLDSADPLPTVPHMKVIAKIGSTFYDLGTGPFVVPSGHSHDQVFFQVNDDDLNDNVGAVTFDVQVCNNQAAAWTSTLDFRTNAYASLLTVSFGVWVPGVGYKGTTRSSLSLSLVDISIAGLTTTITSMTEVITSPGMSGGEGGSGFNANGSGYGPVFIPGAVTDYAQTHDEVVAITSSIEANNNTGTHSGDSYIHKWIITGTGTKPSVLP